MTDQTPNTVISKDRGARTEFWTTRVAAAHPFRYWQDVVCRELVELQIETPQPDCFEASMHQQSVGPIGFNIIAARQQAARRTREAIGRTRDPRFDLVHIRQGSALFEHYGRSFELRSGECVLIDSSEPYSFTTSEFSVAASLQIPQKWLRTCIPTPEDGVAVPVQTHSPWGNALLATLNALTPESLETLAVSPHWLAEQIAGLLALAIRCETPSPSKGKRKLLARIRQTIADTAHDEQVCPESVASAHHISKRYLHLLFAAEGTTFSRELLQIRLERAERLLRDGRFKAMSVSEIGWRCGFVDSSHFARRFQRQFGRSPSEYRRLFHRSAVVHP
jgi:AraC-like DNA-binding protein/mannose-6-phosphate isomerase-like protein (cupin superfamily)